MNPTNTFLSRYIHLARTEAELVTDADVLKEFDCFRLMAGDDRAPGFSKHSERRADVLNVVAGLTRRSTAMKMPLDRAAALLQDALDAGDATPSDVIKAVGDGDLACHQDPSRIFHFLHRMRWWEKDTLNCRLFMAHLLEIILELHLLDSSRLTAYSMAALISPEELLADNVPVRIRAMILSSALSFGEKKDADTTRREFFNGKELFVLFPPALLVSHIPLPVLYRVVEALARRERWLTDTTLQHASSEQPEIIAEQAPAEGISRDEAPIVSLDSIHPSPPADLVDVAEMDPAEAAKMDHELEAAFEGIRSEAPSAGAQTDGNETPGAILAQFVSALANHPDEKEDDDFPPTPND